MSASFVTYGTVADAVHAMIEAGTGPADPDALGRALLEMNAEAMRQRCPQSSRPETPMAEQKTRAIARPRTHRRGEAACATR